MKWYEIHGNMVTLCRYLVDGKHFDAAELLRVVAEPWHWEKEFNEARRWAQQAA